MTTQINNTDKAKTTDINDLINYLAGTAMNPLLDNSLWQCYGYAKRPKHGSIVEEMFPKKFELDKFITKEVLTMGLIDVLNGIKGSNKSPEDKIFLAMGLLDIFIFTTKHLFPPEEYMEELYQKYGEYLKAEKDKLHITAILRAREKLNKKNAAKFLVGTTQIFASNPNQENFLIDNKKVSGIINDTNITGQLKISMPKDFLDKHVHLIITNILDNNKHE
ncbi:MAG: hypothetical protein WC784_00040 [Candidatus Shapirobacteria bacterium]|jgi:hypothetical protein